MKEELKTPNIVVVLDEDGVTRIQTISYDNFVSYRLIDNNKLEVVVQTIKYSQETYVIFNISPHNTHVLRAVKYWTVEKKKLK